MNPFNACILLLLFGKLDVHLFVNYYVMCGIAFLHISAILKMSAICISSKENKICYYKHIEFFVTLNALFVF